MFFQAEDGIRDGHVTGVQTCALPISLPPRARQLVELYARHVDEIDEQLATPSRDWPLRRMPAVDRAVLRPGSAEGLHQAEGSVRGLIIGGYTKNAEELSGEESPRFVNGLLQRLVDVRGLLS